MNIYVVIESLLLALAFAALWQRSLLGRRYPIVLAVLNAALLGVCVRDWSMHGIGAWTLALALLAFVLMLVAVARGVKQMPPRSSV